MVSESEADLHLGRLIGEDFGQLLTLIYNQEPNVPDDRSRVPISAMESRWASDAAGARMFNMTWHPMAHRGSNKPNSLATAPRPRQAKGGPVTASLLDAHALDFFLFLAVFIFTPGLGISPFKAEAIQSAVP